MGHSVTGDDLRELDAMTTIARVLATLDQPGARQRVMRWAAERFHLEAPASTPIVGTVGAPLAEEEVDVDEVNDVFNKTAAAEQVRGNEPLDTLLRELAADFQRLALECPRRVG